MQNNQNEIYNTKINAFDKKVIYVYKHLDVKSHEGWLKVGETHESRIRRDGTNIRIEEQNSAANVAYEVLYTTDAVTNSGELFSDKDIHDLLEAKDIEREETLNPNTKKKSEWFKTDLKTIVETIEEYKLEAVRDYHDRIVDFTLRDEQKEAVEKTKEYFENCRNDLNIEPSFLWNAKPRFGKTLTAYCFASSIEARKVLIVTNRPAVADSWYTDFNKFDFKDENQDDGKFRWIFTASDAVKKRLNKGDIITREEQLLSPFLTVKNTVHFISLQDIKIRGQDGEGFKEENKWIFDLEWDLVIIDESHEGVDTGKADRVFGSVNTKFTLHLSGTPFKALASNKFNSKQIYNWSYTDEQKAKEEWSIQDGQNPYADLPKMNIFTYQLSRVLETTAEQARDEGSEYAFDLMEFFRVVKVDGEDKFAYEDRVKLFVKNLSNPKYQYPFSSEENRENLRHTFWLLPGVKACKCLKKVLLEDEYFGKNYSSETIIMAADKGDDDKTAKTILDEVRLRIGLPGSNKHPMETRTITLSCGQLNTGVTIPEWTAVLMLNNCKSPSVYMQSAFRAQNPFKIVTSGSECFMKENCFVFDFAPDRILQTLAEMADSGVFEGSVTRTREQKVRVLINFLPVIAEDDEGKMKYLDANEVLTIPLKLITEEVVNRGFMSNRLFENISGIFGCPQDIRDIIAKMDEAKGGKSVETDPDKKTPLKPKVKVWVGEDNKIHINEDIVVATTNGLFGEKKYVEIGSDEGKEVQETLNDAINQARNNGYSGQELKAVQKTLQRKLPTLVAKIPDPVPQPGEEGYVEKEKPDDKPNPKEKSEEEKTRDRLRGFARTIPSFLMAYGTSDTTLANFGDNIPDNVFEELTNITKEDFRKLRDGGDFEVTNEDGEKETAHFKGFINETVFNSAVQAFEKKQKVLACYYKADSVEDIFEYIPPQSNNQIFTPKRVVKMMVEMLEKENPGIFKSTTNTFIDLYMKSGMYITEIVKKIFEQTREEYDSDFSCVKHILENQVFGFAPSGILDAITKNYIFGFDEENLVSQKNFIQFDTIEPAKTGTLKQIVNQFFNKEGGEMKFTAVIGNPPYQENTGGGQMQAKPVYHIFVDEIKRLNVSCFSLITPSRYFSGGMGLDEFRERMLSDRHIKVLVDYANSADCFAGVSIAGGINYFLWDESYCGPCRYTFVDYGDITTSERFLDEFDIFVRNNNAVSIINKVQAKKEQSISEIMSSLSPFGIGSAERGDNINDDNHYVLLSSAGKGFIRKELVTAGFDKITKYKVAMGKAASGGAASVGKDGMRKVIASLCVLNPNEVCTFTYFLAGCFDTENEAVNCLEYISSKFVRFLLLQSISSINISKDKFRFVPIQDFTHKITNEYLYKKYGLDSNEIQLIEKTIGDWR